ncbi:MAG TPA: hypothetical protein VFE32_15285 [Puia sp.]|jgi:hypothetical protein|nr:hypothetical protein [Puia sp.]
MIESLSISRRQRPTPAEDYQFLRRQGIKLIEDLCGKNWTDYNAHDPGITLLEAYCFALTELGYRTSFDMKDLLTAPSGEPEDRHSVLYAPERILPSNPVTLADYRKLVADIAGVRNAWVEKSDEYEIPIYVGEGKDGYVLTYEAGHGIAFLRLKGLLHVRVEFEEEVIREKREEELLRRVTEKLHHHRNLCEDIIGVKAVDYEPFTLEAEIKVKEGCDIDLVTAQVYQAIRNLFSPAINFYSPDQLKERGYVMEELFEGPVLQHGFIDGKELDDTALNEVQLSDVIRQITAIGGVIAIERLSIPASASGPFPDFDEWLRQLRDQQKTPRLDTEASVIQFSRSGDRHRGVAEKKPDMARVRALLNYLLAGDKKVKLKTYRHDWAPPAGEYMDAGDYFPFQRSLPACYRMDEEFTAADAEMDEGRRSVLRLRGFLYLFEQLLANALSQVAHVRELFSMDATVGSTYFTQIPKEIHNWQALFVHLSQFEKQSGELQESLTTKLNRRNAMLDHLLGRFGEELQEHEGAGLAAGKEGAEKAIRDKAAMLQDAVALSNYRGKGFDYTNPDAVWDTDNVAGCKKRVCRLLGMPGYQRTSIASNAVSIEEVRHDNGVHRYIFRLVDPADRETQLLRSIEYETRKEAEVALEFLLEEGGNRRLYELDRRHERPAYHLRRATAEGRLETVGSGHFHGREEMEEGFERLLEVLAEISGRENFHLVEHILLRPRIDARGRPGGGRHPVIDKERVELLPIPAEEQHAVIPEQAELPEQPPYRFTMEQEGGGGAASGRGSASGTGAASGEGKDEWRLRLVNAAGEEVLAVPETFAYYKHLTRRMEHLRRIGAEENHYQIDILSDGYFGLSIHDGGQRLAESRKRYKDEEKAREELDRLVRFFAYDWRASAGGGDVNDSLAGLDPYSFRVTIVLPSWPARFRDPGFRHLVEKTLFLEIPAHVSPNVYWVGHEDMRRFEDAYKSWLTEQANEGIPNTEVLNNFLFELNKIRE